MKFLALLFIFLIFSVKANTTVDNKTTVILEAVVTQANLKTPIKITPTLTMEHHSTKGGELTYHYKSTYSDATKFNRTRFVKDRSEELTKKVCTEASQKIFRDLNVVLNYEYLDKNDKLLAVISINAGDCN